MGTVNDQFPYNRSRSCSLCCPAGLSASTSPSQPDSTELPQSRIFVPVRRYRHRRLLGRSIQAAVLGSCRAGTQYIRQACHR